MNGFISFNNNSLQTDNIITNVINHTDLPEQTIGMLSVANSDYSAITNINTYQRVINIAGVIKGTTQIDLDNRIDAFKAIFSGKNRNLDITYGIGRRRYIATKNSIGIERTGGKLYANFTVGLICTQPYGRDVAITELIVQTTITTATQTFSPTVLGNAPYQLPRFSITINSLTGTGDYVSLTNNVNNQGILIYGKSLKNGDIISIDCDARTVALNDIPIDYSGLFFELEPGYASINYTDGFTTRNVSISADYRKRWL